MCAMVLTTATAQDGQVDQAARVISEMHERVMNRYGGTGFDPGRWSAGLSPEERANGLALLASLRDPAVRRLEASEARTFLNQMSSNIPPGIGLIELLCIDLAENDGRLTVITPVPGTPAAAADIRTGDVIVEIDGKATAALSLHRAAQALLGESGSQVTLLLDRGGRTLQKTLRRAPFPADAPLVTHRVVMTEGQRIGYLGVLRFNPGVAAQAVSAMAALRDQRIDALALDLRNNPGGGLSEAIELAGLFLPEGTPVAALNTRGKIVETFKTRGGDVSYTGPLVVLQNAGSASAAEVIAGAIRAASRGRLVGEHTFGKGLVHSMERLPDESALMLPIGRLMTPDGIDILAHGISPDVPVADTDASVVHGRAATATDTLFNAAARIVASAATGG